MPHLSSPRNVDVAVESSVNFRRVTETITTSGTVEASDLATLGAYGYDAVVNLLPDRSEHAVADERAIVERQGLAYIAIPVDFRSPTREAFESFVVAMDAHEGDTVHVHCAANYRVSAFFALYAERKGWWDTARADEHIHDLWDPSELPAWQQLITDVRRDAT